MDTKATRFLTKSKIDISHILYFLRNNRKTELYLEDGSIILTYIPVKDLLEALPKGEFLNITKGVVISADKIKSIQSGTYTMVDGKEFIGRKRGAGEHKANRKHLEKRVMSETHLTKNTVANRFVVLDNCPLPTCVVEVVENPAGHTVDYIFRYCNKAMSNLENFSVSNILDHSHYEIFPTGDKKWVKIYYDVALKGLTAVVTEYNSILKSEVSIYCYQPLPGFCACTMAWIKD